MVPGLKPDTITQSLGFKPSTVAQSPGFKPGTLPEAQALNLTPHSKSMR